MEKKKTKIRNYSNNSNQKLYTPLAKGKNKKSNWINER